MIWIWLAGAAVLAAGAAVPAVLSRRDVAGKTGAQLDKARSMMSELEGAIDAAGASSPAQLAEAQRCLLLAGAALANESQPGPITSAACRRSQQWSRKGMHALGSQQD